MSADTLLPAPVSVATAERLARELYALDASAVPLPGEYDNNFHLTTAAGGCFVLKVMHPSRDRGFVDLQCRALEHLAERAPGLPLQRVVRALSGEVISVVEVAPGVRQPVWAVGYIDGKPYAQARPHTGALRERLGSFMGELTTALADFSHPAAERELKWDLANAGWISEHIHRIADPGRRAIVTAFMEAFATEVLPALPRLRRSVIHGDANDYNVLTESSRAALPSITGVIDFGDMHRGLTIAELAITAAYALLSEDEPIAAAVEVVAGFHRSFPLEEIELRVLFPLIAARLCVSVANSAIRKELAPDDPYITISEAPAWSALEALARVNPDLAHYSFRDACGLAPVPHTGRLVEWLSHQAGYRSPIMAGLDRAIVMDLSVGSLATGADPAALEEPALTAKIDALRAESGAPVVIGRYDEARGIYTGPAFGDPAHPTRERRTIHLGLDLFAPAGTPVYAPFAGVVELCENNSAAQDYGPLIVLRHDGPDGLDFHTLYGHLSLDSVQKLVPGQRVEQGGVIATVGANSVNGGWTPHLHFQLISDLLALGREFPGVARASQRSLWRSLSPDPNVIVGIAPDRFPAAEPLPNETLRERHTRLGGNLSLSYRRPLKIVRGWRQYLYDETGRAYLDAYNNVPVCGHSHPRVVRAVQQQIALLNTNTRYLHDNVLRYAARLTALLPQSLEVCYFVNSATEANELALRLARNFTRREDVVVLEHAYHGNSTSLVDISPYKFDGPGGSGRKPWVHVAPVADDYRGAYKRNDPAAGTKYAAHVGEMLAGGVRPAAFIAESLPSVGGQVVFPPGYLAAVYEHVRSAGGVCIADEVQTGFGRLGTPFWGFETQGVVPDMVVLGKPIGNGFPLGAVITRRDIADAFDNGMEFFSTFGGNPVACAAGLAVLDVLRDERLPQSTAIVGRQLLAELATLKERHALVGDVRGLGLFLGIELVRDRATLEPADSEASYVVNRMREHGILAGTDGPFHNVVKIRPPLCFTADNAQFLASTLDSVLGEDGVNVPARS